MLLAQSVIVFGMFIPIILLAVKIGLIVYIYKDAERTNRDPWLWVLLALFTSSVITLIIYMIVVDESKDNKKIKCSFCGAEQSLEYDTCVSCGKSLVKDERYIVDNKKPNTIVKILLGLGIVGFILTILLFIAMIFDARSFNSYPEHVETDNFIYEMNTNERVEQEVTDGSDGYILEE